MPKARYPHLSKDKTRHGKTVWYFRIGKGKRTRLKGDYGSDEFMASYREALASSGPALEPAPRKRSLRWLVDRYLESAAFKALRDTTRAQRRNILIAVCKTGGNLSLDRVDRAMIAAGRDRRAETPHAAINFMKTMGYLFEWAVDSGHAKENPVRGIKRPKVRTDGHAPWTVEDVKAYYARHKAGSMARLAMDLLLFTGLRRQDVYRLGPQHLKEGRFEFRARKNDQVAFIALHPALDSVISGIPADRPTYILTEVRGRPFRSAASFGNWFGEQCASAGVNARAHGLRKLLAQLLEEAGSNNGELNSIFAWTTDSMANLYTRKANRRRMAESGFSRVDLGSLVGAADAEKEAEHSEDGSGRP